MHSLYSVITGCIKTFWVFEIPGVIRNGQPDLNFHYVPMTKGIFMSNPVRIADLYRRLYCCVKDSIEIYQNKLSLKRVISLSVSYESSFALPSAQHCLGQQVAKYTLCMTDDDSEKIMHPHIP